MPRRLVIFSIDSRNEGNESKREKKKVFFGRGGGTLFPLSPFGAITGLFSEPDENLVGLRGRKFLRSLGKKKKKKKEKGTSSIVFHGKRIYVVWIWRTNEPRNGEIEVSPFTLSPSWKTVRCLQLFFASHKSCPSSRENGCPARVLSP